MMRTCVGCRDTVRSGDGYIVCATCKQYYHRLCVNISDIELNGMAVELKMDWLCPDCVCRRPRGDNSNTPIRGSPWTASIPTNVTMRRRPAEHPQVDEHIDCVSRSLIRIIINEIVKEYTSNITRQLNFIHADINSFKESLTFFNEHFEKMKADLNTQTSELQQLKEENTKLCAEVNSLTSRVNLIDQISRSANLELQYVPEHKNENVMNVVQQLGRAVNCPVGESDISHCTRIAKMNQQSSRAELS
ncbi:unnamed protein product [Parnassius mnemosyne]|uniref:PHD-type domain-containing protein n=1 Tax=Parnassius mnemosyne TaxID=213953 RepID=A0AAV1K4P1_9NEOP